MSPEPWFVTLPERLERELRSLRDAGATVSLDEAARLAGRIRLSVDYPTPDGAPPGIDGAPVGGLVRLEVAFPDTYPSFRPDVRAPGVRLPRHVHPESGGLCLLTRPTDEWTPSWTVADLLDRQLPRVLRDGGVTDSDALADADDEQAEPLSGYYPYLATAPVLVDDSFLAGLGGLRSGRLMVGLPSGAGLFSRLAAVEVLGPDGPLSELPEPAAAQFPDRFRGAWYRLPEAPPVADPASMYRWVLDALRREGTDLMSTDRKKVAQGQVFDVMGLVFPEEHAPGQYGLGLAFVVRVQGRPQRAPRGESVPAPVQTYVAKAARISRDAYAKRAPLLRPLHEKTVLVVGLGTVGAPVVLHLGRAGVGRLRLADFDVVEAPTTVRWPIGLWAVGAHKVQALRQFVEQNYPLCSVDVDLLYGKPIGRVRPDGLPLEQDDLDRLFDGVDLVVDATAEGGVTHILSVMARERGVPLVAPYATRGAWGGVVVREVPGQTDGCWMCFKHSQFGGTLPMPPEDESGGVQPLGCMDPTFTGAGFDLAPVSAEAARMAVATLCQGHEGAYPDLPYDVGVLGLVDADGVPTAPTWTGRPLDRHPDCPYCVAAEDERRLAA
ncbi:MAG: hypothetical protein CMJ44_00685 [Pimelobacter sp.]|nr:hypothetical protein [Pimelobacter sp.]